MKSLQFIWLFIKAQFTCIHLPSNLTVNNRLTKIDDDGVYEYWLCECTCKCGEKVNYNFSYSKDFLNKTGIFKGER